MLQAPQTDAHVLLFEYVRLLLNCLRCNLSGVRLIELCYYNNSATIHAVNGLASSHATIATLLSGLKPCHKDSIKRADQACACKMPRADVASLTKY